MNNKIVQGIALATVTWSMWYVDRENKKLRNKNQQLQKQYEETRLLHSTLSFEVEEMLRTLHEQGVPINEFVLSGLRYVLPPEINAAMHA